MGGDARITGRINVVPPVTWRELHDKPWATGRDGAYPDVVVKVDTTEEHRPTGVVKHMSGVAVTPTGHETNGYELLAEVQRIVDAFSVAPDGVVRSFDGFLHVVWGGDDVYRVHVVDGGAREVRPEMRWPAGAADEDSVEPRRSR